MVAFLKFENLEQLTSILNEQSDQFILSEPCSFPLAKRDEEDAKEHMERMINLFVTEGLNAKDLSKKEIEQFEDWCHQYPEGFVKEAWEEAPKGTRARHGGWADGRRVQRG